MRCIPGIFDNGRVDFPFSYPDYAGPVAVLVVFPGTEEETIKENDPSAFLEDYWEPSGSAFSGEDDDLDLLPF